MGRPVTQSVPRRPLQKGQRVRVVAPKSEFRGREGEIIGAIAGDVVLAIDGEPKLQRFKAKEVL